VYTSCKIVKNQLLDDAVNCNRCVKFAQLKLAHG
jgi:hypothetical protein